MELFVERCKPLLLLLLQLVVKIITTADFTSTGICRVIHHATMADHLNCIFYNFLHEQVSDVELVVRVWTVSLLRTLASLCGPVSLLRNPLIYYTMVWVIYIFSKLCLKLCTKQYQSMLLIFTMLCTA
jgi:hypothetical protein